MTDKGDSSPVCISALRGCLEGELEAVGDWGLQPQAPTPDLPAWGLADGPRKRLWGLRSRESRWGLGLSRSAREPSCLGLSFVRQDSRTRLSNSEQGLGSLGSVAGSRVCLNVLRLTGARGCPLSRWPAATSMEPERGPEPLLWGSTQSLQLEERGAPLTLGTSRPVEKFYESSFEPKLVTTAGKQDLRAVLHGPLSSAPLPETTRDPRSHAGGTRLSQTCDADSQARSRPSDWGPQEGSRGSALLVVAPHCLASAAWTRQEPSKSW